MYSSHMYILYVLKANTIVSSYKLYRWHYLNNSFLAHLTHDIIGYPQLISFRSLLSFTVGQLE